MALLTFKDGTTEIVDYNTAAKVHQIQQGAVLIGKEVPALKALATKTVFIDFKKLSE